MEYYTDWRRLSGIPQANQEFRQGHLRAVSLLDSKESLSLLIFTVLPKITLITRIVISLKSSKRNVTYLCDIQ